MATQPWTIVLAAGAGRRLAPVTGGVPKQFWRPLGADSLLEATLERLRPVGAPERTLTIVDAGHTPFIAEIDPIRLGDVLYQPMDRGTAAGVLLPLLQVLSAAEDAIVVVTPSDHGVDQASSFRKGLARALGRVEARASDIVLFGAAPSTPSSDFGWITPASDGPLDGAFRRVAAFVEKPPRHQAEQLFSSGAVWNTMVLVARARALFDLYRRHLPFHADVLARAQSLDARGRQSFLNDWYADLPLADFCRDVLSRSADLHLYTWPDDMGWSDLGTPERLAAWLASQAEPLFQEFVRVETRVA
jgi:mannose-1-phosphate guanylyltransferase